MWLGKLSPADTIKCSEFVKRQTINSGYSHFNGSWDELEDIVWHAMSDKTNIRPGYKDGIILVDLNSYNDRKRFYSGIVKINQFTKLKASWAPRLTGENSFIRISSKAEKQQAERVTIVLYHADVLAEDDDRSSSAAWEIIAIKARVTEKEEPMDPYTMARNFSHLKGGTQGDFTAQQFAESIIYWNNHCMVQGKKSIWTKIKSLME